MSYQLKQSTLLNELNLRETSFADHFSVHKGNVKMFAEQIDEGVFPGFSIVRQTEDLGLIDDVVSDMKKRFKHLIVVGMGGSSLGGMVLSGFSRPARGTQPTLHFINNPDPVVIDTLCSDLPLEKQALWLFLNQVGRLKHFL